MCVFFQDENNAKEKTRYCFVLYCILYAEPFRLNAFVLLYFLFSLGIGVVVVFFAIISMCECRFCLYVIFFFFFYFFFSCSLWSLLIRWSAWFFCAAYACILFFVEACNMCNVIGLSNEQLHDSCVIFEFHLYHARSMLLLSFSSSWSSVSYTFHLTFALTLKNSGFILVLVCICSASMWNRLYRKPLNHFFLHTTVSGFRNEKICERK